MNYALMNVWEEIFGMIKRFGAFLAAVVIAMTVSATVSAVPDEESGAQTSQTQQASAQSQEKEQSKQESSQASAKEETDPDKITFTECEIPEIGMHIDLPDNMYILTADISPDDPALTAVKLTKQEMTSDQTREATAYLRLQH